MKCSICGEKLSRNQMFCPRCGFNPNIKGLSEKEIHQAFEAIDRLPPDFDLFEWIEKRMKGDIDQNTTLLVTEEGKIKGRMPECSGVLGDFQNIVQKKEKRKHLFRFCFRTAKVHREDLESVDPYYNDVLPEDWGGWDNAEKPFRFRQPLLLILSVGAVITVSAALILNALLI